MLPALLGTLGVSGTFYALLKLIWPTWYLDILYLTMQMRLRKNMMKAIAQGKFVIDFFEEAVKTSPNKPLIIHEGKRYSYMYIEKKANQFARALVEIGVTPGSTVALMIYNEPAIVWSYLGAMKAGCTSVMINHNLRTRSLAHCINASGAKVLIIGQGDALIQAVTEVLPDIPGITVYAQGASAEPKPPGMVSFETVMTRMSAEPVGRSLRKDVLPTSICVLIYTSGTTGLPKAAPVSHVRCLGASFSYTLFGMTADDVTYVALPMYHSVALMIAFSSTVVHGATMVLRDKFSARHFWDECREYNVTVIQYIGELCRYLLAQPKSKKDGVHKIRVAFGNGLRQDIWHEFKTRFNIPRILEFYGATESPIGFCNISDKVGSFGRASPFLERFVPSAILKFDVESQSAYRNKEGRCVPIGINEVGLLTVELVEGKISFSGYKGNKKDSEKKILRDVFRKGDKFFNTGDLVRMDKDYFLYFSDRVGDTFRWKGENVSTTEVSNLLTELPFIQDANVYGVAVPGTEGRAGMATLVLQDEDIQDLTPAMLEELSKHVRKVLPAYARPRFIRIQAVLELTSTYKQQKMTLVREGFDINQIRDTLFYLHPSSQTYEPLDQASYNNIMEGKLQV